jgi:hypothetical protein
MAIIRRLDDLTFAPTPHEIMRSGSMGMERWTEIVNQATIFHQPEPRLATVWRANIFGFAFQQVIKLYSIKVAPYAQHPHYIRLVFKELEKGR